MSKIKTELEAKNEEEPMKVSGWVLDKITSRQHEMYKTNSITGRTYVKLLIINQAVINITKMMSFAHCGQY